MKNVNNPKKTELGNIIYKSIINYTEGELENNEIVITNGHHLAQKK
jgi:hypothetical protein